MSKYPTYRVFKPSFGRSKGHTFIYLYVSLRESYLIYSTLNTKKREEYSIVYGKKFKNSPPCYNNDGGIPKGMNIIAPQFFDGKLKLAKLWANKCLSKENLPRLQ